MYFQDRKVICVLPTFFFSSNLSGNLRERYSIISAAGSGSNLSRGRIFTLSSGHLISIVLVESWFVLVEAIAAVDR
jgi:hypothetical protein